MKTKVNRSAYYRKFNLALTTLVTGGVFFAPTIVMGSEDIARGVIYDEFPTAVITDVKTKGRGDSQRYEIDYKLGEFGYEAVIDASGNIIEVNSEEFDDNTLIVGLAAFGDNSIYTGGVSETQVYPLIWYDNGSLYFQGASFGYRFYKGWADVSLDFDLALGEGYDPVDNKTLSDLPELDGAINVGLAIEKEFGDYELSLGVHTSANGSHKGTIAELGFGREFELSDRWSLEVGASVTYNDKKYNDYYYGVKPQYALENRPAYVADSDIDTSIEVGLVGQLSDNWFSLLQIEHTSYGSEVTNSPIVEKSSDTFVAFGIGYNF